MPGRWMVLTLVVLLPALLAPSAWSEEAPVDPLDAASEARLRSELETLDFEVA